MIKVVEDLNKSNEANESARFSYVYMAYEPKNNTSTSNAVMASLMYGDISGFNANDVVNSTLSRICMRLLVADASLLYINPAAYGTNTAWRSSNGNQWGLFEWCGNLKKGPYIKYLKTSTFNDCKLLTDIYYIGDGSEITNTPAESGFDEPEGGAIWFNDVTSSEVETLTIHVKPGVSIPYKPANAVVVEDLELSKTNWHTLFSIC